MCQAKWSILTTAVLCLWGRAGLSEDAVQVPLQLKAAVDRLVAAQPSWPVHSVDKQPTVNVDGHQGYRVVLRSTWKEPPPGSVPQQIPPPNRGEQDPTYLTKHLDWHFVLFSMSDSKLSPHAKRDILWHVPDEKLFRLPVALGEGHGFVWFTYTSIPMQHFVREQLKLSGGDDRLQLALRGLSVIDEGMNTRNSVMPLFAQFGHAGFAALDQLIRSSDDPSNAIRSLAYFPDAEATARLVELIKSPHEQIRRQVGYARAHQPYRPAAKEAYFDMLRQQLYANEALQACVEFGWKEALPLIEGIVEKPSSWGIFRDAYKVSRQLSDNPLAPEIVAAASVLQRQSSPRRESLPTEQELANARRVITGAADVEGAAFVGISLALFVTKGNVGSVNQDGLKILQGLPDDVVERMLNRLLKGLPEADQRPFQELLRKVVQPAVPAT